MPKKRSPARAGNAKKTTSVARKDTVSATEEERAADNQEATAEAVKKNRKVTPAERAKYLKKKATKKVPKAAKKAAKKKTKGRVAKPRGKNDSTIPKATGGDRGGESNALSVGGKVVSRPRGSTSKRKATKKKAGNTLQFSLGGNVLNVKRR